VSTPSYSSDVSEVTHIEPQVFVDYVVRTRWFGGKGRPFSVTGVRRLGGLGTGDPYVDVLLVELTYDDVPTGSPESVELYQVPLAYYTDSVHRLDHAFIGWWEDPRHGWVHAYDALHDRESTGLWLAAFGRADLRPGDDDGLTFRTIPGHDLDLEAVGSLFSGEQSNSSVLFGEDSVLKVFRKITPGANPDITTHDALTRAGSTHVAHLYGWVEAGDTHLGMLQQFLRTATDGWDLALTSVRDLMADPDTDVREAGGDFSGESGRLGEALGEVHADLRTAFPVTPIPAADVAAAMVDRLRRAQQVVPGLAPHVPALEALYARLAALGDLDGQTVHGDLHLGQTLRTSSGWKIVDFEGEPAKTLAERLLPDSPWRDVAGMLRSFDYAPHVAEQKAHPHQGDTDAEARAERAERGREWTERQQRYFLTAYAGGELTDEQRTVVSAYTADKAVYETVYETRNRPTWVEIPLAAVARIGAA
jgi:maltokinase